MNYETDSEDELPTGWEEHVSESGDVYFFNQTTNAKQW